MRQIRAAFTAETVTVYQAYAPACRGLQHKAHACVASSAVVLSGESTSTKP